MKNDAVILVSFHLITVRQTAETLEFPNPMAIAHSNRKGRRLHVDSRKCVNCCCIKSCQLCERVAPAFVSITTLIYHSGCAMLRILIPIQDRPIDPAMRRDVSDGRIELLSIGSERCRNRRITASFVNVPPINASGLDAASWLLDPFRPVASNDPYTSRSTNLNLNS